MMALDGAVGTILANWLAATSASPTSGPASSAPAAAHAWLPQRPLSHGVHPGSPHHQLATAVSHGLGDFTWAQVATLAGALIAAGGVVATLLVNAARSRRDALSTLYADALGAVADYLEGPYRILRKGGDPATRFALTSKMADVKTAIDHNQALLRLHADTGVADAYDAFVQAAKREAGAQMHEAWKAPAITTDEGVNLHVALPRGDAEAARDRVLQVMQADLRRRWWNLAARHRYRKALDSFVDAEAAGSAAKNVTLGESGNASELGDGN